MAVIVDKAQYAGKKKENKKRLQNRERVLFGRPKRDGRNGRYRAHDHGQGNAVMVMFAAISMRKLAIND